MKTDAMLAFERCCPDSWGFDFTINSSGYGYEDHNTGIVFGAFLMGWNSGRDS